MFRANKTKDAKDIFKQGCTFHEWQNMNSELIFVTHLPTKLNSSMAN
jgi:hypothetical protein